MAIIILTVWYCDFKDSKVVIVPAPAIKGKAIGTIEAVSDSSSLYKRIPKIISSARKKEQKLLLPQKNSRQFQLCLIVPLQ